MTDKHMPIPGLRRQTSSQQRREDAEIHPDVGSQDTEKSVITGTKEEKSGRESSDDASLFSLESSSNDGIHGASSRQTSRETVALIEQEGQATTDPDPTTAPKRGKVVSWRELPRKDQLIILTLARLAEPLAQTSLQAYMYYMLKSFDPNLTDSHVASQAGLLSGAFTAAQCLTAVWWGRLADKEWMGRKNVLLIGLLGTFISTLGFGFSRSFTTAMVFRAIGGGLNGNVGVMRTMISEIIKEKKYQPKAFLLLPMTFNVGVLIGPLLGGWLQNPVDSFPGVFGPGSKVGGVNGVQWMVDYPYALPNVLMASIFVLSISLTLFGLEETHIDRRERPDPFIEYRRWLRRQVCRPFLRRTSHDYSAIEESGAGDVELPLQPMEPNEQPVVIEPHKKRPKLPFRRIFTPNVCLTFLAAGFLHTHVSAFNNVWFLFLSTPRFNPDSPLPPSHTEQHLPFHFNGGLGLPPSTIGFAIGIIGVIGLCLQFGVYSRVVTRLGIVTTYRIALACTFPFVYLLVPYLAVIPTSSSPPHAADGPGIWIYITAVLFVQVVGRTFCLPITQILVNNCTPHPSVLGSVHGIGQSVSSACRTIGPVAWSMLYGWGLRNGIVGMAWWMLGIEACVGAAAAWLLREGSGHEIWLEGD